LLLILINSRVGTKPMVSYPLLLYKITEVVKSNYFLSVFLLLVFLTSLGNDVVEFLTLIMMMPIKRQGGSKAKYMALCLPFRHLGNQQMTYLHT
jgi:hypothetical protein